MLKTADLFTALTFFAQGEDIILQVPYSRTIPLLRREIVFYLGTPDMSSLTFLKYGGKYIKLVSVGNPDWERHLRGYDITNMFYIGYADEAELSMFEHVDERNFDRE